MEDDLEGICGEEGEFEVCETPEWGRNDGLQSSEFRDPLLHFLSSRTPFFLCSKEL